MNLLFLTYNNYYNRIIKREESVADYKTAAANNTEFYDIQFNPNDGVMTEQIVNWTGQWTPDYLICYVDTTNVISSRWFVIEWVRTRGGQYKATLYRDTIADNLSYLKASPMYIEKAKVPTADDVAIYNKEILETNQIKTREFKLKDKSKSAWLVGYFAKNINWGSGEGELNPNISIPEVSFQDAIVTNTLSGWSWSQYITNDYNKANSAEVKLHFSLFPSALINNEAIVNTNGDVSVINGTSFRNANVKDLVTGHDERVAWVTTNILPDWTGNVSDIITSVFTESNYKTNDITFLNGQTLYVESGADAGYYDIKVIKKGDYTDSDFYAANSLIEQNLCAYITNSDFNYPDTEALYDSPCIQKNIDYTAYRIDLKPKSSVSTTFIWPNSARKLFDAPYGMFCMPANEVYVVKNGATQFKTLDEYSELNIMCTIAERLNSFCYDIQKLPFCPIHSITANSPIENAIDITELTEGTDYAFVKNSDTNKSIVLFASTSSGTFDLNKVYEKVIGYQGIEIEAAVDVNQAIEIPHYTIDDHECDDVEIAKISNQCDFYRMYSPNWSASFEFNPVKTGVINTINVDFTYKPYAPYIHINPVWGKLYGKDYNDYRGLICQGDFSIPRINDQWQSYQINNKNYLNAFNREIDNLELKQDVERKMQVFNAITGTVTGGAAGAAAGAKGGGVGAGVGAAIGAGVSAVGGALDVKYGEILRNEALDYRQDQFNYSLQNIQARPDTLAKVSTYDENNAVFPVIEYYTATIQEKEALYNKMKFDGMTIMRIGTLEEFLNNELQYIKGRLIRNDTIQDDYHVLTAIAEELNKGVFM